MSIQSKTVPTYWIELIAQENVNACPSPTFAIPLDTNVTIKQCVRRPTLSPFSRTECSLSISKKNLKVPSSEEMRARFSANRSISLAATLAPPTNAPQRSRTSSLSHGVSPSNVRVHMECFNEVFSDTEINIDENIIDDKNVVPGKADVNSALESI